MNSVSATVLVALIVSIPPFLVAIFSRRDTKRELNDIHILVNGRMSDAIEEIKELRDYIGDYKDPDGKRAFDKTPPPSPVTVNVEKIEGRKK